MRSREPDVSGFAVTHQEGRDDVRVHYEVFGEGSPTVVLLPTWSIVPSRFWKAQIGPLARRHRVITFDGRGSGLSDRPSGPEAYSPLRFAADTLSVLDATTTDQAVLVGFSCGAMWGVQVAADHADRVLGLVCIGPAVPLGRPLRARVKYRFGEVYETTEGWAKYNRHNWLHGDYEDFLHFFFTTMTNEPHSTKQVEDCIGWGREIDTLTLADTVDGMALVGADEFTDTCGRLERPLLVIHGDQDRIRSLSGAQALADLGHGSLFVMEGAGHGSVAREPVKINAALTDFIRSVAPQRPVRSPWTRPLNRPTRALYLSSPIGLGHARRDVAIAGELRKLHPGLQIDWLAQDPVTRVLEGEGEPVHPASAYLASESAHVEAEAGEHDLHAFQAIRRMDEILVNNFSVFADLVDDDPYDLWIGDEAWDVDYFLHENPELKNTSFAWMTDFVGWLPMPDGGEAEARLTADYNAEMIMQRARFRRVRDRSIFIGNPDDIVPDSFGPGLPGIRDWTRANFDFAGYATGFDPAAFEDRQTLRAELGYRPDEQICVVTVGGSGVGTSLLQKVIQAYPTAAEQVAGLRMIVVTGPRIDPGSLTLPKLGEDGGLEVHGYLPQLYRQLAACDLAVVQGGLTTCMELTANRRPFLYFPLGHHFEQNFHVRHRLDQYQAGRCMDYRSTSPEEIGLAIASTIGAPVSYRPVETDGAARAARLIGELL